MRAQKRSVAIVVLAVLAGGAACALADVAATVDPTVSGFGAVSAAGKSIGWRFFVDKEMTITHLGLFDQGDDGLAGTHVMGIWRVKKEGGLRLERWVTIAGNGDVKENHHVYVALGEPLTIVRDPVPGAGGYERWLVGVWSALGDTDGLIILPKDAGTMDIVQTGIMRLDPVNATNLWRYWSSYPDTSVIDVGVGSPVPAAQNWVAWPVTGQGSTGDNDHYGINFKYTVPGPHADVDVDSLDIYTSQQATTTIPATATHTVPGTSMQYEWFDGVTLLTSGSVGTDGDVTLDLASVSAVSIGEHALTLKVTDGVYTASDTMTLRVDNSPPKATVNPASQVIGASATEVKISAELADFDGNLLNYRWLVDDQVRTSSEIQTDWGGNPVSIPPLIIPADDLPDGPHQVQLMVGDGSNPEVEASAVINVDRTAPTLAPKLLDVSILWPPDHTLRAVTIAANAGDNLTIPVTLAVAVQSNEPADDGGDGSTDVDWYMDSDGNPTGIIALRLRAERSGDGTGRIYTVTITATDEVGNQSSSAVQISVPHDSKKK
jgi:hypothetical protein